MAADLVVDASGGTVERFSGWRRSGSRPQPSRSSTATSRTPSATVRPSDPDALGGTGFFVVPSPDGPYNTRGGYVVQIEGDQCLAGLAGRFGDYPPTDVDEWRQYGRTLEPSDLGRGVDGDRTGDEAGCVQVPPISAPSFRTSGPLPGRIGSSWRHVLSLQSCVRPGDVGRRLSGSRSVTCSSEGPEGHTTSPGLLSSSFPRRSRRRVPVGARRGRRLPRSSDHWRLPGGGTPEPRHVPARRDARRHRSGGRPTRR